MANTRKEFTYLLSEGLVSAENAEQALIASKILPNALSWKNFLSNLLLLLGGIALASSAVFFIAYNWDDMGRFAKFGLVELLIALSIFIYWKSQKKNPSSSNLVSQVALLVASIFLGVLLAFYGQTYQTGADPWQLFFTWAMLILPWTIISRFPALWILWLALINLSASLYASTFHRIFGLLFNSDIDELWLLTFINASALIIWEVLGPRFKWHSESWAIRLIALAFLTPLTFIILDSIFGSYIFNSDKEIFIPVIIWLIALAVIYVVYRKLKIDLFMLAIASLSGISILISFVGKFLFDNISTDIGSFFLLTLLVIALGGGAAVWLKRIHHEQQEGL